MLTSAGQAPSPRSLIPNPRKVRNYIMLTSSKRPIVLSCLSALFVIGVAFAGFQPTTSSAQAREGTEGLPPGARIETVLTGMIDPDIVLEKIGDLCELDQNDFTGPISSKEIL